MFRKNRCISIESLLWECAAQTLTVEQRRKVEAHIAQCSACREELETCRRITATVTNLREAAPPPSQASWQELRQQIAALPNATRPAKRAPSISMMALFGATLAGACAVLLYLRPQPASTYSPNLQVAGLPVKVGVTSHKEDAPPKKPTPQPMKTGKPAPKKRAKDGDEYRVYSAFDKQEFKRSNRKKSEPMIAQNDKPQTDVARIDSNSEHTLKFALDAEVPLEPTSRRFVMGSVPAGGYSVVPASYENKELKAW